MDKNFYTPHDVVESLKPYIRRIMVADCRQPIHEAISPKPTGYNYLNWQLDGRWVADFGTTYDSDDYPLFFAGQIDGQDITVTESGCFRHVVVEFSAFGLYQLTGMQGDMLVNKAIGVNQLDNAFSRSIDTALIAISKQNNLSDCLNELQKYFVSRLDKLHPVPDYLHAFVDEIEQADGAIRIAEISEKAPVSSRHLHRRFKALTGISPKKFAKILQLNRIVAAILSEDRAYFSEIAAKWGYYDESHMIKTIQAFLAQSPTEFLTSRQETVFAFLSRSRNV